MNPVNLLFMALVHQFPSDTRFVPHASDEAHPERSWEMTIRERMDAGCNVVPLQLDSEGSVYLH